MTPSNRPPAVPHADTLPCPAGGLHVLTNDRQARTYCTGCGRTWAELDEAVRK